MSQRQSGYRLRLADDYPMASLASQLVIPYLPSGIGLAWDCAEAEGAMVRALNEAGIPTIGTGGDFLKQTGVPDPRVNTIITNALYGHGGKLARQFIEHALELVPLVAMLLRVDLDSRTQHLFRY